MGQFTGNSIGSNTVSQLVKTAVAAGQTAITSDAVDTAGFGTCQFEVVFGTITSGGVQSIKVQQSSDDGVADGYSDLAGTSLSVADSSSDKLVQTEIIRPGKRYLKCIVSRATQNSVVNAIIAHLGNPVSLPVSQHATVVGSETHITPAEGTA